jgi:hypothetical protein
VPLEGRLCRRSQLATAREHFAPGMRFANRVVRRRSLTGGPASDHNPPVAKDVPSVESVAAGGSAVARRAGNSRAVEAMARGGLAARGLTYLVIASIAAQIAVSRATKSADPHGAIEDVASQPFGRFLLIVLALGFAAFALWRWSVAALGSPGAGGKSAVTKSGRRLGALATGFVYAGLCATAIRVVAGRSASSSTQQQQSTTAWLLGLPLGRALVIAIGVGVVIGGCALIWWAFSRKFEKNLATEKMGSRVRTWATVLGVAGNGASGIVLVLVGIFLVQAADANEAGASKGLDQTLRTVAAEPSGKLLLLAVAVGLAAYGLYSLVEMRFRRV